MALVVGLDIGTKTITGAVFSGSGKKFRLVDFFTEEVQALQSGDYREDGEYIAPLSREELLAKVIADRNLKDADIVTAVDAKDCVIREINVPFTKDEQIRKTVFFEAENHFTGFDLEDAVLEYVKVGESDDKSRLIVAALRNELIENRLAECKAGSVDPVAIDMDACALFNAYTMTPMFDPSRASLVVDMGTTSTKILLVENGELRKIRSMRLETFVSSPSRMIAEPAAVGAGGPEVSVEVVGGEAPPGYGDYSIENRFEEIENALRLLDPGPDNEEGSPIAILSDDEFDRVRQEAEDDLDELGLGEEPFGESRISESSPLDDVLEGDETTEAAPDYSGRFPGQANAEKEFDYHEYLERIGVEIQRSLAGARLDSPIELICLTGGMSRREEARRFFVDEFDVETVAFDFGDRIPADPAIARSGSTAEVGATGAVAVGLALKQLGHDNTGVDFRKGPYRYEHKFERVKLPLLVASLLLFLLFLQATFWAFRDWKEETKRLDGIREHSRLTYKEFFGEDPKQASTFALANRKKKEWESGGAGDIPRFVEYTDAVRGLADVMKNANLSHFELNSVKFGFRIKGGTKRTTGGGSSKSSRRGREASAPPATVTFDTDDNSASRKVKEAFANAFETPAGLFEVIPTETRGREGVVNVTLKLTIPAEKLKKY